MNKGPPMNNYKWWSKWLVSLELLMLVLTATELLHLHGLGFIYSPGQLRNILYEPHAAPLNAYTVGIRPEDFMLGII